MGIHVIYYFNIPSSLQKIIIFKHFNFSIVSSIEGSIGCACGVELCPMLAVAQVVLAPFTQITVAHLNFQLQLNNSAITAVASLSYSFTSMVACLIVAILAIISIRCHRHPHLLATEVKHLLNSCETPRE